jgi:flagellar protein FlbT
LRIHLKQGEKIYVNGAILRVDRRATLEFLNDVTFILEPHVLQIEDAVTPLRRLHFVAQAMLVDPSTAGTTAAAYRDLSASYRATCKDAALLEVLAAAEAKVAEGRGFDALKLLRAAFEPLPQQDKSQRHGFAAKKKAHAG